jgi:hypothetical protein
MTTFNAVEEARLSYAYVYKNVAAFLRIGGPWIALSTVILFSILMYSIDGSGRNSKANSGMLLVLLLYILAVSLTFPIFMLGWQRFVLTEKYPRFGILQPGRASWSFLWRWWVASSMFSAFDKTIVPKMPQLVSWLGANDAALAHKALDFFAFLMELFVVGLFALGLPAIALGDQTALRSTSTSSRRLGRSFGLGVVISAVLYPATDLFPSISTITSQYSIAEIFAICLVSIVMHYFALAVLSTYLCRAFVVAHPGYGSDRLVV